jgi:hypothetical protein
MVRRVLLLVTLATAGSFSQQQNPKPETDTQIPPFKPRFNLPPKLPWRDKLLPPSTSSPSPPRRSKTAPSKTCSVPLIDVTPRSKPYIPNFLPKKRANDRIAIPPPAPACEEDREEESRR